MEAAREQNIFIKSGLHEAGTFIQDNFRDHTKIILTDTNVREHCLPFLLSEISSLGESGIISVEPGEENKTIDSLEIILSFLARKHAGRDSLLINLGGGMIGDLGGFAASVYKRGIPFINIPTTLLAMADASTGGKNGINLDGVKNIAGTFTLPSAVFICPVFLRTLPQREIFSGFAEVIKHALLSGGDAWNEMRSLDKLPVPDDWSRWISHSVSFKHGITQKDFHEEGIRAILNFGHTIGHSIESASLKFDRDPLTHGESIALGMIAETFLSRRLCGLPEGIASEIAGFLRHHFRHINTSVHPENIISYVRNDKKNKKGKIIFSLLKDIGNPTGPVGASEEEIVASLNYCLEDLSKITG
jgi:3-dehydroquinate synthase